MPFAARLLRLALSASVSASPAFAASYDDAPAPAVQRVAERDHGRQERDRGDRGQRQERPQRDHRPPQHDRLPHQEPSRPPRSDQRQTPPPAPARPVPGFRPPNVQQPRPVTPLPHAPSGPHIQRPAAPRSPAWSDDGRRSPRPSQDDRGMSLHGGRELVRGPQRHDSRSVIGDRGFRGDIARHHASAVRGQYHWYTYGRHRYCHYWDHNGYRWWGFYIGVGAGVAAAFFWTRWYEDRFWWYEPRWGRWCYYDEYDGYWHYRWNDADYLYDDGTYYRYEQTPTGVRLVPVQPAGQPADTEIPSPQADPNASTFCASNMSACVVISGPDRRAVLTTGDGVLVSELTQAVGVEDVDFSDPNAGPLEIVLTLSGGRVLIFNGRGQLLNPGPQGGLETPRFGELHERLDGITPAGLHSVLNSR